ncbi:hypothetical protein J6E39_04960 [bacterium]|nr:hypothetical protein [bacterium]
MNIDAYFADLVSKFDNYKERYKNPKTVASKLLYYGLKKIPKLDSKKSISNTWYKVREPFNSDDNIDYTLKSGWNIPDVNLKDIGEHLYFSIDRALKMKPDLKGVWLVFFMGIGDYFNASGFIEQLKNTYPELEFNAFVSKNFDGNNSPLVGEILKTNPNISRIEFFDGKPNAINWRNYDYTECYSKIPDDYILIPVVYEYNSYTSSRHKSLCETFGLEVPVNIPLPKVYPSSISTDLEEFCSSIKNSCNCSKGVVFLQMSCRSCACTYSYAEELLNKLLDDNYTVISVDKYSVKHKNYFEIDTKKFSINDSVQLLSQIKTYCNTYCITMNSCFWAISAALNIPNLGMQFKHNPSMISEYFPNIFVISDRLIGFISCFNQYIASRSDYEVTNTGNYDLYLYKSEFVYSCFKSMIERVSQ